MNSQMEMDFDFKPYSRLNTSPTFSSCNTGEVLKRDGMQRAETHANQVHNGWSAQAMDFLRGYAEINKTFMAEDVRVASEGLVPEPPSKRAWGGVIRRAAQTGMIRKLGIRTVKNAKAHDANATYWQSLIIKRR